METKMAQVEAEEDRQWTETQQKKAEQEQRARNADMTRWEGLASQGQHAANVPLVERTRWEKSWEGFKNAANKTIQWIDQHQTEIAIGIGVVAGLTAVVLTAGTATPFIVALGGAMIAAGGIVAAGTLGLNAYYRRPIGENILRNVVIAAGVAGITTGAGLFIAGGGALQATYTVGNGVAAFCTSNPTVCTRAEFVMNIIDKYEEAGLAVQGIIQTARGDTEGAAQTAIEWQAEHLDGGLPGNTVAVEIGEEIVRYGDDAAELIATYGDDAVNIIEAYGDEGIALLLKFGDHTDDAINLVKGFGSPAVKVMNAVDITSAKTLLTTLDEDVLDYAIQQGPDAVAALSRWSKDELMQYGPELALRAKKDATVLQDIKELTSLGPIDSAYITYEQQNLIKAIAENSTQYSNEGQIVLGKWVDYGNGFAKYGRDTGSVHYNPHPDMWNLLGNLGKENREEAAWLINKEVIQTGIDRGIPFEYSLNGVPADDIFKEQTAVQLIFSGETNAEIMQTLNLNYIPIRMKELQELQKAGYKFVYDEMNASFILSSP
jgi:hypothetical protein